MAPLSCPAFSEPSNRFRSHTVFSCGALAPSTNAHAFRDIRKPNDTVVPSASQRPSFTSSALTADRFCDPVPQSAGLSSGTTTPTRLLPWHHSRAVDLAFGADVSPGTVSGNTPAGFTPVSAADSRDARPLQAPIR